MRFLCMLAAAGVDVVATVRTLTAAVDGRLVGHVYSVPDLRGAGGRMQGAKQKPARLKTGRILDAGSMSDTDRLFLRQAYQQAKLGYEEGGCPIGSALARGDDVIAVGRNRRVQQGDPIAHGEMDCLRVAGRQTSSRDMTLYTTLSPCLMCAGSIVQFAIPRVVVGEAQNFLGNLDFLADRGVEVILADDPSASL